MQGSPSGAGNVSLDKAIRLCSVKRREGKSEKVVGIGENMVYGLL